MMEDSNKQYTLDELWDAVTALNPNQPLDRSKVHILSMIIPNIIAARISEKLHGPFEPIDINKNIAFNLLTLAYFDLMRNGHYNLKEAK